MNVVIEKGLLKHLSTVMGNHFLDLFKLLLFKDKLETLSRG